MFDQYFTSDAKKDDCSRHFGISVNRWAGFFPDQDTSHRSDERYAANDKNSPEYFFKKK
jgi:hypothetical protein